MSIHRPHVVRVLLFAGLACALLATGALAAVSAVSKGAYRGKTKQGIAIRLGRTTSAGRAFRYRARMSCSDGTTFLDDYFTDDVAIRHNRFRSHVSSDGGAVLTWVTGTFHGLKARGTVRIEERYSEAADPQGNTPLSPAGAIVCDSHVVHWTATADR
jgi:hypothetical protein